MTTMTNQTYQEKHGGYRNLKSYQTATLIYDLTVEFCNRYMTYPTNKSYRMIDQMVQAARSGRQNIAEGSQASVTSKKTEIKLVGVARASLEELLIDYEDFLRQRSLSILSDLSVLSEKPRRGSQCCHLPDPSGQLPVRPSAPIFRKSFYSRGRI